MPFYRKVYEPIEILPVAMSDENEFTTIMLPKSQRDELDELKEHRREPLYEVIQRAIDALKAKVEA